MKSAFLNAHEFERIFLRDPWKTSTYPLLLQLLKKYFWFGAILMMCLNLLNTFRRRTKINRLGFTD